MACFRRRVPEAAVYFVCPLSRASWAARRTFSGVGKSGSPAPRSSTSAPARRSFSTSAVTAIVFEADIRAARDATGNFSGRPRLADLFEVFAGQGEDARPRAAQREREEPGPARRREGGGEAGDEALAVRL